MVPLTSSPLPPPPRTRVTEITPCLPEERDGDTDAPVRVLRIYRSDARSQSPKWARRPRPARGRPARSRRGREPETAGYPTRFSRHRPVRLLLWIRAPVPRKTTAALVAAAGEEGCRPAPETLLDSG